MSGPKITYRYSLAFKQKVVSEIESGQLSVAQARKVYDIGGGNTIYVWLRKLGKNHLIKRVVRIEMKDEKDKLKELERQNRELESALAQSHLETLGLKALLASVEEHYGIDVKKTFGSRVSKRSSPKSRKTI